MQIKLADYNRLNEYSKINGYGTVIYNKYILSCAHVMKSLNYEDTLADVLTIFYQKSSDKNIPISQNKKWEKITLKLVGYCLNLDLALYEITECEKQLNGIKNLGLCGSKDGIVFEHVAVKFDPYKPINNSNVINKDIFTIIRNQENGNAIEQGHSGAGVYYDNHLRGIIYGDGTSINSTDDSGNTINRTVDLMIDITRILYFMEKLNVLESLPYITEDAISYYYSYNNLVFNNIKTYISKCDYFPKSIGSLFIKYLSSTNEQYILNHFNKNTDYINKPHEITSNYIIYRKIRNDNLYNLEQAIGANLAIDFCTSAKRLVEALKYIHDLKVLHLDIRPSNILLGEHNKLYYYNFDQAQHILNSKYKVADDLKCLAYVLSTIRLKCNFSFDQAISILQKEIRKSNNKIYACQCQALINGISGQYYDNYDLFLEKILYGDKPTHYVYFLMEQNLHNTRLNDLKKIMEQHLASNTHHYFYLYALCGDGRSIRVFNRDWKNSDDILIFFDNLRLKNGSRKQHKWFDTLDDTISNLEEILPTICDRSIYIFSSGDLDVNRYNNTNNLRVYVNQ